MLIEKFRISDKFFTFGLKFDLWVIKDIFLGFIIVSIAIIIFYLFAFITGSKITFHEPLYLTFLTFTLTTYFLAASEELLFRGIIFQAVLERFKPGFTIIFTSIIFALAHFLNPHYTFLSAFNIFLAGILLAIMYIKTLSLWLPITFHFLWNWCQLVFLGSPISGYNNDSFIIKVDFSTLPHWLSGGEFGIEGGIITTLLLLSFTIIVIRYSDDSPYISSILFKRRYLESQLLSG
ncbi:MAG: CPBP family intramembrane glutamic endopeptidase [FCB group bacterium]|jgi:membrane protease YdiL (CAAX protease family)